MELHVFTCPECAREIEFTPSQREAALATGCPVCGASIAADHFD